LDDHRDPKHWAVEVTKNTVGGKRVGVDRPFELKGRGPAQLASLAHGQHPKHRFDLSFGLDQKSYQI
jgi:hypothetical protein